VRNNLLLVLAQRLHSFPRQLWRNLATNEKYQVPLAIGYSIGAVSALYSILSLFYKFNIDMRQVIFLPFSTFFSEQVLPFVASPLVYAGLDLSPPWHALLAISSIGGAILARAEFRTKLRWSKHIFSKKEAGPRWFDLEDLKKNPGMPEPPKHTMLTRAAVFGTALLLGYSFVGLVAFAAFFVFGLYFFYRDVVYVLGFLASNVLYVFEHFLAPYERWGDDNYWGTRWFLAFFTRRQKLDRFIERYYIDFWRVESLDPKRRHWMTLRNSIRDGGRVVAITLWLSILVALLSRFIR
jgi:hypothetical protein